VHRKARGVAALLLACGASLAITAPALAAPNGTDGHCRQVHYVLNSHKDWWQTNCLIQEVVGTTGIPVQVHTSGASKIVGHLSAGWQRFYWQVAGKTSTVAHRTDNVWAKAIASNGQSGYVNELWFAPAHRTAGCTPFPDLPRHGVSRPFNCLP
jgi:hypothetical protein